MCCCVPWNNFLVASVAYKCQKREKKQLHKASCLEAKVILQKISDVPLDYLEQTSNADAVLCTTCEQQLLNIYKTEES